MKQARDPGSEKTLGWGNRRLGSRPWETIQGKKPVSFLCPAAGSEENQEEAEEEEEKVVLWWW